MATAAQQQALLHPNLAASSGAGSQRAVPLLATTSVSVLLDLLCVGAGVLAGCESYHLYHHGAWPARPDLLLAMAVEYWLVFVFLARSHKLYDLSHSLLQVRTTENLLRISCFCLILVYAELYLTHAIAPRLPFCVGWLATVLLMLVTKHATRGFLGHVHTLGRGHRRVLIVGTGSDARRIFSFLRNSRNLGLNPVGFVNEGAFNDLQVIYSHDYKHRWHAPVYHNPLSVEFLLSLEIAEVFIADPLITQTRIAELAAALHDHGITLSNVGDVQVLQQTQRGSLRNLDGMHVISFSGQQAQRPIYETIKRAVDVAAALLLLLFTLPACLAVAALVRFTSPGPVLFRQERIGHRGRPFTIWKFRSMYAHAPKYGRSPESSRDNRITPVGRFLRKTSLDELPQLWNVLRGDMSLVGPRPEMPYVVAQYSTLERRRLSVPQGLTGLWQLSADRKYSIHQSLEYDAYYVENRGFFLDAAILVHTLLFAVRGI